MGEANRENVLIIMAADQGFPYNAFVSEGYNTVSAYNRVSLFQRLLREFCFRLPGMPKEVWYNPAVKKYNPKFVYIRDAIITKDYLLWLQKQFPTAQINFSYENMVGKARHLRPDQIPKGIRVWTYDPYDSEKYGIRLKKTVPYYPCYVKESKEKKYDLLFVGRDKGRGDWLKNLEEYLNGKGIKTKFLITADGRFSKRKSYYEKPVSYEQVTDWVAESRALLNVGMENQKGITMRDIESHFNRIKLVTTNRYIENTVFFDEENTFFLNNENWNELVEFLRVDYVDTEIITWDNHRLEDAIREVTS